MNPESTIIRAELPHVAQLFATECRAESRRRGHPVTRHDPAVRLRVADLLLSGMGARIRREIGG